jgi:lysophospholipase L1-like esterase
MKTFAILATLLALNASAGAAGAADDAASAPASSAPSGTAVASAACPQPPPVVAAVNVKMREEQLEPGRVIDMSNVASLPGSAEWRRHSELLRLQDWAGLCRYRAENAAQQGLAAPRAVFIGSSITELWPLADPLLFGAGVVGRGIGGQTSPQMLVRFMQDVVALRPQVVHIMAGVNDIAGNTGPTTDEDYRNNIRAMVTLARANGIAVILGSLTPAKRLQMHPKLLPAPRIVAFNHWLRGYAAETASVYVDYHAALRDAEDGLPAELGNDGLHPNRNGFAKMQPLALAALTAALQQASKSSSQGGKT